MMRLNKSRARETMTAVSLAATLALLLGPKQGLVGER
jgi:hypothetical protein